jgi:hypothetical protein
MNKENAYLVILLVVGIVVLSNLAMLAMVRGWREFPLDWFKRSGSFSQPFKSEDSSLDELRQRVEGLERKEREDSGPD